MTFDPNAPVLIGSGQVTQRKTPLDRAISPVGLMSEAIDCAAKDAGIADIGAHADVLSVVRLALDLPSSAHLPIDKWSNLPASVARAAGLAPARQILAGPGGNTPQTIVNALSTSIAQGEHKLAVIAGAEALYSQIKAMKQGHALNWGEDLPGKPEIIGTLKDSVSRAETDHNMYLPVNAYGLIENGIRAHLGRTVAEHLPELGKLFAPFTSVAAKNPYAWFPIERSAEELSTVSPDNRIVGYPYPKLLNSIIQVDQGAALILTSAGYAKELGVDPSKWVYLHGCADADDIWYLSERINFYSSPAINMMWRKASEMAGVGLNDISFFDIYSCFPSAVQVACTELGLELNDPRGLTVTGGLPYFGGPGNNYVTHSIASMMDRCRANPGHMGLVTANGWYITKHAIGLYSTTPPKRPFEPENQATYQAELDAMDHPSVAEKPSGRGKIETFTIPHSRKKVFPAIVIGRLEDDRRFIAATHGDDATVARLMENDPIGQTGTITPGDKGNLFAFD